MRYVLFLLPLVGLITAFGIALRAPRPPARDHEDSAFTFANHNR